MPFRGTSRSGNRGAQRGRYLDRGQRDGQQRDHRAIYRD